MVEQTSDVRNPAVGRRRGALVLVVLLVSGSATAALLVTVGSAWAAVFGGVAVTVSVFGGFALLALRLWNGNRHSRRLHRARIEIGGASPDAGPAEWQVVRRRLGTRLVARDDLHDLRSRLLADRAVVHYAEAGTTAPDGDTRRRAEVTALDAIERAVRLDRLARRVDDSPSRLERLHTPTVLHPAQVTALADYGYEQLERDLDRLELYARSA